jgi:hypothetical protein
MTSKSIGLHQWQLTRSLVAAGIRALSLQSFLDEAKRAPFAAAARPTTRSSAPIAGSILSAESFLANAAETK